MAEVYTAASQVVAARELGNAVLRGRALSVAALAGEAVPGIRTLDIPGSAITARVTVIRMAGIMVIDPVGATIRITDIVRADLILTDTGTGLIWASASAATKLNQHR